MRRRKLFTLAAGASAVLFVGVCVLWVRSYFVGDRLQYVSGQHPQPEESGRAYFTETALLSEQGCIVFRHECESTADWMWQSVNQPRRGLTYLAFGRDYFGGPDTTLGFRFDHQKWQLKESRNTTRFGTSTYVSFPIWAAALLTLALPAGWVVASRRRRKRARLSHICPACGYDLRATPHRCPEMFSLL